MDLGATTFLDSSGLGAVVGILRRLRERGGRLLRQRVVLFALQPQILQTR